MDPRPVLIALILIICVLSSGCTSFLPSRSSKGPAELTVPSWRLVSYYNGDGTMVPVGPRSNISLKFGEEGTVSGFIDGCWRYSGRYTTLGETIRVTNLTGSQRAPAPCLRRRRSIENTSFSLLQKSPRFNINEGTLVFGYYDAQRYLVFFRS